MKKNSVVKISAISQLLFDFNSYIHSDLIQSVIGKRKQDFTRNRNMCFFNILYFLIFRSCSNLNSELSSFYSSLGCLKKRISKQAMHKAVKKVNPNVFTLLIHKFSSLFYKSNLPKTYKGYIILSEDGTSNQIPYSTANLNDFQYITSCYVKDMFDVRIITAKAAGLYDVTNGLFLDYTLKPSYYSETLLAFEHLYRVKEMLDDFKVVYLADRYYGSAEIISHLESIGFKYCIRGKSNFFKKQVAAMKTDDEWIEVEIDQKWRKRFRFSPDALTEREKNPVMKIRVVKFIYEYIDKYGKRNKTNIIYFTNLDKQEFSVEEIISLYVMRWDIEVSYKTLKTDQEIERHYSDDGDVARCNIYAKILFFNIAGLFRKELNKQLEKNYRSDENQYLYNINIVQLHEMIKESNIMESMIKKKKYTVQKKLREISSLIDKIKVPIRENRHNERWGKIVVSGFPYRFTLDGRNYPKLIRYKGTLMTKRP